MAERKRESDERFTAEAPARAARRAPRGESGEEKSRESRESAPAASDARLPPSPRRPMTGELVLRALGGSKKNASDSDAPPEKRARRPPARAPP